MKYFSFLLTMLCMTPIPSFAFTDTHNHVFESDIQYVQEQGIVHGYADGSYKPESLINRAEFTKIVIESLYPAQTISACNTLEYSFSDVWENDWFAPYVCIAKREGIINGYADGTFQPQKNISLPEAMKIILEGNTIYTYNPMEDAQYTSMYGEPQWYDQWIIAFFYIYFADDVTDDRFPNISSAEPFSAAASYNISRGEMAYFISWLNADRFLFTYTDTELGISLTIPSMYKGNGVSGERLVSTGDNEQRVLFSEVGLEVFAKEIQEDSELKTHIQKYFTSDTAEQCSQAIIENMNNDNSHFEYLELPKSSPLFTQCIIPDFLFYSDHAQKLGGFRFTHENSTGLMMGGEDTTYRVLSSFQFTDSYLKNPFSSVQKVDGTVPTPTLIPTPTPGVESQYFNAKTLSSTDWNTKKAELFAGYELEEVTDQQVWYMLYIEKISEVHSANPFSAEAEYYYTKAIEVFDYDFTAAEKAIHELSVLGLKMGLSYTQSGQGKYTEAQSTLVPVISRLEQTVREGSTDTEFMDTITVMLAYSYYINALCDMALMGGADIDHITTAIGYLEEATETEETKFLLFLLQEIEDGTISSYIPQM